MKKTILFIIIPALLLLNIAHVSLLNAEEVVGKIASENVAKEIAAKAGGQYIEGATVPAVTEGQTALPVINE